jgi:hypothetical protein
MHIPTAMAAAGECGPPNLVKLVYADDHLTPRQAENRAQREAVRNEAARR